jgi:PHP family Zn ribbon phosphoesterase
MNATWQVFYTPDTRRITPVGAIVGVNGKEIAHCWECPQCSARWGTNDTATTEWTCVGCGALLVLDRN